MPLTFARISPGEVSLYGVPGETGPFVYFLLLSGQGPEPPETLGMEASWGYAASGAYVVSEKKLTLTPSELAALLKLQGGPEKRAVAWLPASQISVQKVPMLRRTATKGEVLSQEGGSSLGAVLSFANVTLHLNSGTVVTVTEDGLSFAPGGVELQRSEVGGLAALGPATASFDGPATGRVSFPTSWDPYRLFNFFRDDPEEGGSPRGGELRYFREKQKKEVVQLLYPLFKAVPKPQVKPLSLEVELDPLAPFDGSRTRMRYQAGAQPVLTGEYAAGTSGRAVTLTPQTSGEDRAGFYFGRRPSMGSAERGPCVYLAPLGAFALGFGAKEEAKRLMCGTSALEFLTATDRLVFEPGRPAFVPLAEPEGEGGAGPVKPLLDPAYTTSWVSVPSGAEHAYFGQPQASTSYGMNVVPAGESAMTYPAAVASRVRDLSGGSPTAFPMVFYGGALIPADLPVPPAEELMAFENSVLAPERGARLRLSAQPAAATAGDASGRALAEAAPAAPVFNDADGKALEGGTTSTPQGFVVELNPVKSKPTGPAGTWSKVLFARAEGTKGEKQWLSLAAGEDGEVDPWLATSLVKDQLFLVLNDWSKLQGLKGVLNAGGFDFEMAPEEESTARETVMVFKYATSQSLREMIEAPATWYLKEHFVGDESAVREAQETLKKALEAADNAEGQPDDPFQYFRDVVARDPAWTGLLTFNGKVPGTGMPPDLQILYAGLDEPLRAHHFGVELNQVERSGSSAGIKESSLFGVIHYLGEPREPPPPAPRPDYVFTLRELNVLIRNSAVREFHAKVWLRANRLFGREVKLKRAKPPPETLPDNTILFVGQYQRHGSVGTVTFTAPGAEGSGGDVFDFTATGCIRVLDAMRVSGASLVPVSSVTRHEGEANEETESTAQVTLSGGLSFAPAPFPGVEHLDLFSYEDPGIGVSGLALTMTCTLYKGGGKSPTEIVPDLSGIVLADNLKARREEGLLHKLPLGLKGFLHEKGKQEKGKEEEEKLDIAKLGALSVNVPELAEPGGRITSQPTYALEFDLPMGTLGGLADAHASIDAKLILGWGPSTYAPDDDAVGVFVQPPFLSGGAFGLELQGLLKTTFGDANLARVKPAGKDPKDPTYVLLFNNIAISVLGIRFPPRVIIDFILFAGSDGSSNLGWSLAALEPKAAAQLPAAVEQV